MHKKTAVLIRDITQFGGGEKDVVTLIEGLNENGITPHLFSEKNTTPEKIKHFFNKEIHYTYKPFPRPSNTLARTLAEILLPHPLKNVLRSYDVIYDFTNKPPVFYKHSSYIKYIYIIEDSRVLEKSFLRKIQFILYSLLGKMGIKKFIKVSPEIRNITQSSFVQNEIAEKTNIRVPIIYPPVDHSAFHANSTKQKQCVMTARFSPEKNHFDVLTIAQALPDLNFTLIGKVDDTRYLKQLKNHINDHSLKNITLITDASFDTLKSTLEQSSYFISTTKNEHFGIAIVEAIAAGCIPFSHNSGGPIEILKNDQLLFTSAEDAAEKIGSMIEETEKEQKKIIHELQKNLHNFSEEIFKEKMIKLL